MRSSSLCAVALMSAGLAVLPSCKGEGMEGEGTETVIATPSGAAIIDTYEITATVTAIDPATRKVTLTSAEGGTTTFKAGKNTDISQIQVGERIKATLTEELAIALVKDGGAPSAGEADAVALAAHGRSSDVLMADALEVTAKVTNVDAKSRKVTLQMASGKTKTIKVGKQVDLAQVKPGDDVVARLAEAVAIDVKKS